MADKIIGLKELRENMEKYAAEVQKGRSITVVKRSKPLFKLTPVDEDDDANWETIIDFREVNPNGVPAKEVLVALKALREEEGRPAPSPQILLQPNGETKKVSKEATY